MNDARLRDALRACVRAMRAWAAEEDGLPQGHGIGAFEAVDAAEWLIGRERQHEADATPTGGNTGPSREWLEKHADDGNVQAGTASDECPTCHDHTCSAHTASTEPVAPAPCPWCGGAVHVAENCEVVWTAAWVVCDKRPGCEVEGPVAKCRTKEEAHREAIAAWNRVSARPDREVMGLLRECRTKIEADAIAADEMSYHGEAILCRICGERGSVAGAKRGVGDRAIVHVATCLLARLARALGEGR